MLPLKDHNPTTRTGVVTILIIVACVGIYLAWQKEPTSDSTGDTLFALEHAAVPCEVAQGRPLTVDEINIATTTGDFDTCTRGSTESPPAFPDKSIPLSILVTMFLHGSLFHLGGNMLFLWVFGNNVEDRMGIPRFIAFYIVGGVIATLAHVGVDPSSTIPVIGASGAIAAVMGTYAVWFPRAPIRSVVLLGWFVFLREIPAGVLLGFWFVLQFFTAAGSGVAWVAHVGGFLFGAAVGAVIRYAPATRRVLLRKPFSQSQAPWSSRGYYQGELTSTRLGVRGAR